MHIKSSVIRGSVMFVGWVAAIWTISLLMQFLSSLLVPDPVSMDLGSRAIERLALWTLCGVIIMVLWIWVSIALIGEGCFPWILWWCCNLTVIGLGIWAQERVFDDTPVNHPYAQLLYAAGVVGMGVLTHLALEQPRAEGHAKIPH